MSEPFFPDVDPIPWVDITRRNARSVQTTIGWIFWDPGAVRRFEALVEAHFADHWKVADYARALAVTPTHLTRVVRASTGGPASKVVEMRLIHEARRHLVYTQASVTAVAYGLGFADPAHFTRVFSRVVGVAPREFRARASG